MKKNTRILLLSGTGLAVLGGVTAVLLLTAPQKDVGTSTKTTAEEPALAIEEAAKLTLCDRTESDTVSVDVTNDSGSYSITQSGNTDADGKIEWTITDIAAAPLNYSTISTDVGNIISLEAKEFAEEVADTAELAKYGLDTPKATVKAKFTDGSEFTLKLGIEVPTSSTAIYITADDKNVYTLNKSKVSDFLGNKYGFVKLEAVPDYDATSEEVKKMTVERFDLEVPLVIESIKPENEGDIQVYSYRMVSPYSAYADLTDSPNFMYSVFGLTASSCEGVGLNDKVRELTGLNEPLCVITTESNIKTYTVTLGKAIVDTTTNEDGTETRKVSGFYGITSEVPDVLYCFDASSIAAMQINPEQLISKLFLMPYIYSLDSVTYSDPEGRAVNIGIETIKAQSENEQDEYKFTLNGEPTAEQPVKDLYQYFISASGEELYFDEDKGELIAEINYNYADKKDGIDGKDTVRFYSSNTDRKVIIEVNGQNLFKTRKMYTTQLYANIDNFLSGKEIILTY